MMGKVINFAGFQVCWFACVLGAASGAPALGVAVVGAWAAVHLARAGAGAGPEAVLMAVAVALGFVGDSLLVLGGWMEFPSYARLGAPTTIWMLALWVALATTLGSSLGWLRGRFALAAAAGAVAGPIAYWAGLRLGAVVLPDGARSLLAVAALWAVAMPALLVVESRLSARLPITREAG